MKRQDVGTMESGEAEGADVTEIKEISLNSWKEFQDYAQMKPYELPHYVWRGQRDSSWSLVSGLDRLLEATPDSSATIAARHLDRFKQASRGRRGESSDQPTRDNDWWALAQHNAMLTPLLDWTESPFVALYFAFEKELAPISGRRAVWGLSTRVKARNENEKRSSIERSIGELEFIRPLQDDNSRLLNQAALFTKVPAGSTVESWLKKHGIVESADIALVKFLIPNEGRKDCLRLLNRMNINHLSLFPDLYGAGKHCNNVLQIENY